MLTSVYVKYIKNYINVEYWCNAKYIIALYTTNGALIAINNYEDEMYISYSYSSPDMVSKIMDIMCNRISISSLCKNYQVRENLQYYLVDLINENIKSDIRIKEI